MKAALRFLTCDLESTVSSQDLTIRLSRMPAMPQSRMVLRGVHCLAPAGD